MLVKFQHDMRLIAMSFNSEKIIRQLYAAKSVTTHESISIFHEKTQVFPMIISIGLPTQKKNFE